MRAAVSITSASGWPLGQKYHELSAPGRPTASGAVARAGQAAFHDLFRMAHAVTQKRDTSTSSSSPAWWPRFSLMILNRSSPTCSSATQWFSRLACSMARSLRQKSLAAIGQAGERVEVGQMFDLVFRHAAVGHIPHDAGVADQIGQFVEFRLGLNVQNALAAIWQTNLDVVAQNGAVVSPLHAGCVESHVARLGGMSRTMRQPHLVIRTQAEHPHAFQRKHQVAGTPSPVETAHARKVLARASLALLRSSSTRVRDARSK